MRQTDCFGKRTQKCEQIEDVLSHIYNPAARINKNESFDLKFLKNPTLDST
jgi:hypothetical protein